MKKITKKIGWSVEAKLLAKVSDEIGRLTSVIANATTTTTTTTIP